MTVLLLILSSLAGPSQSSLHCTAGDKLFKARFDLDHHRTKLAQMVFHVKGANDFHLKRGSVCAACWENGVIAEMGLGEDRLNRVKVVAQIPEGVNIFEKGFQGKVPARMDHYIEGKLHRDLEAECYVTIQDPNPEAPRPKERKTSSLECQFRGGVSDIRIKSLFHRGESQSMIAYFNGDHRRLGLELGSIKEKDGQLYLNVGSPIGNYEYTVELGGIPTQGEYSGYAKVIQERMWMFPGEFDGFCR